MELEFQSRKCSCLSPAVRQVRTAELSHEVRLGDAMPDIGRVLASWGQIVLRSKEWQSDQITVSGGIMTWILYSPEDGTQVRCLDTWIPFQLRWEVEENSREGAIRVCPLLRFVDSRSVSARKMMIRAGVSAMGEAWSPMTAMLYDPTELPQDVQILQKTYPIRLPKEAGEKTFMVDEELPVPADAAQVERLLSYTVTPQLQERRAAGDKVILRGTGQLHVIYRCPEGKVHAIDLEFPMSAYAQLEAAYGPEAQADVQLGITNLELDHTDQQLRMKCGMVAQYLVSDREVVVLTEDAYSPRRNIKAMAQPLALPLLLDQRTEQISVQQQLPGVEGSIADVTFWPDYPQHSAMGDQRVFDLAGQFQVLYYAPDGELRSSAGRWDGKNQFSADDSCRIDAFVQLHPRPQIAGDTLNAQYKMHLYTSATRPMEMITALELGELQEKDDTLPSLILCRPEGETLWELAKRCGSCVSDIQQANGLAGEPEDNKILLVPVCR